MNEKSTDLQPLADALAKRIGLGWQLDDGHTVNILFASREDMNDAIDQLRTLKNKRAELPNGS